MEIWILGIIVIFGIYISSDSSWSKKCRHNEIIKAIESLAKGNEKKIYIKSCKQCTFFMDANFYSLKTRKTQTDGFCRFNPPINSQYEEVSYSDWCGRGVLR